MHLTIDGHKKGNWVKGTKTSHTPMSHVNAFLSDLDWHHLTGKSQSFNTLVCAMETSNALTKMVLGNKAPVNTWKDTTSIEQHQKLEAIQPRLAWKPLDVIRKTIENTTQWERTIC